MLPDRRQDDDAVRLDRVWASELEDFLRGQLDGAPDPASVDDPVTAVLLAGYLRDRGLLGTVTGMAASEVRDLWRRSVVLTTVAFRLRPGTGEDQSLANSRRGLEAMELGLAASALDLVAELALMVEDPSGATYVGADSVVCTEEEQRLAYATRDLVLGRGDARTWLRDIPEPTGDQALRTAFLSALARGDAVDAGWLREEVHREHLQRVASEPVVRRLDDCVDVPSLAGLVLARHRGLPLNARPDPWLPLDVAGLAAGPDEVAP